MGLIKGMEGSYQGGIGVYPLSWWCGVPLSGSKIERYPLSGVEWMDILSKVDGEVFLARDGETFLVREVDNIHLIYKS